MKISTNVINFHNELGIEKTIDVFTFKNVSIIEGFLLYNIISLLKMGGIENGKQ